MYKISIEYGQELTYIYAILNCIECDKGHDKNIFVNGKDSTSLSYHKYLTHRDNKYDPASLLKNEVENILSKTKSAIDNRRKCGDFDISSLKESIVSY